MIVHPRSKFAPIIFSSKKSQGRSSITRVDLTALDTRKARSLLATVEQIGKKRDCRGRKSVLAEEGRIGIRRSVLIPIQ